jgi:hypothetical protein
MTNEEWVTATRRKQGLPDRVEDLAFLVELAGELNRLIAGGADGTT